MLVLLLVLLFIVLVLSLLLLTLLLLLQLLLQLHYNYRRKEFVVRALIFRWPDVVTYTTIPLTPTTSTFAIHSYSVFGGSDLGVNRKRVEKIISGVNKEIAPLPSSD